MNSRVILSALENVEMSSGYELLVTLFDPQFQKVLYVLLKIHPSVVITTSDAFCIFSCLWRSCFLRWLWYVIRITVSKKQKAQNSICSSFLMSAQNINYFFFH